MHRKVAGALAGLVLAGVIVTVSLAAGSSALSALEPAGDGQVVTSVHGAAVPDEIRVEEVGGARAMQALFDHHSAPVDEELVWSKLFDHSVEL